VANKFFFAALRPRAATAHNGIGDPANSRPKLTFVAPAATPAIAALVKADVAHEVLRYHHDPRSESYGEEAVAALAGAGLVPEQIFKTLVIAGLSGLAVAVLPVPWKLSLKAAAAALGLPKATMAERAAAERSGACPWTLWPRMGRCCCRPVGSRTSAWPPLILSDYASASRGSSSPRFRT